MRKHYKQRTDERDGLQSVRAKNEKHLNTLDRELDEAIEYGETVSQPTHFLLGAQPVLETFIYNRLSYFRVYSYTVVLIDALFSDCISTFSF